MSDTFDAAQEALAGSLPTEGEPTDQPTQAAPSAPAEQEPQGPASREVDISGLPEEAQVFIRARERELQADATRKWQEAAAMRAEAEQSMAFVQALNSDPNFARQVHEYLGSSLGTSGYLESPGTDEFGYGDEGIDPYQAEIDELKQWRSSMEEQFTIDRVGAALDHQIAGIRQANPNWDDEDLQAVINYGFATQGDLWAAAEAYKAHQDRNLARYLERKGSVTAPAQVSNTGGTPVQKPLSTDEELRQAALERIRAELG